MDMDMERPLTFTIDNGMAQSTDGSLIWPLHHPSGQLDFQDDDEAAEFFDRASDYLASQDDDDDDDDDEDEDDDSSVAYQYQFFPASGAAVAGLEKQAFHATAQGCDVTGCAICLENFEDGEEVAVMPCSRGHEFHPECIAKWLGKSNTCPLCRHALPTDVGDGL